MATNINFSDPFESRVKRFIKKFPSLANELIDFVDLLKENPFLGESLGAGLYKVRLASKSKGKGKSGGFRVINYIVTENKEDIDITVLTIYDKSEDSTMKKNILVKMVKDAGL
ncbi:mRNA-degrading endonuclease RelE of RelBE toxin-antitoxin system [Arcicella rosea]|uniref:addiction module toxin RelE n=1 Tax=Arcicella rosea TaxID=502909 RepID=UPI00345C68E3